MKCWNSAFNAQSSRLIIVVVQLGAVKIYVAASSGGAQGERKDRMKLSLPPKLMSAQEKGKTGWNSVLPPNLMVFWVSSPPWMLMYFFAGFFFVESHPVYDQTQGSDAVFFFYYL